MKIGPITVISTKEYEQLKEELKRTKIWNNIRSRDWC
jgi:hypothetical protein